MRRFVNQVVLVTGAAAGIGQAIARALLDEGAKVGLMDINREQLAATVRSLSSSPGVVLELAGDASDESTVDLLVRRAFETFGRLDVLVNSAGIDVEAPITETSVGDWDRLMAVNVRSMFLTCKHAIPFLLHAGAGAIVNISSGAALVPVAGRPAYNASKGAVVALTKSLALDLAPAIRANCVCPGAVDTPLLMNAIRNSPNPEATLARVVNRFPLKRIAKPEEIARAVLFLASSEASFITGAALAVDGGRTLH
jgi:NAD(P)-dependent dehydrogenase (short-subunit alcohol dehydrogenase family)